MEKIEKARVFKNSDVYIRCNSNTGEFTLSERPLTSSLDEIYGKLHAAGAIDFPSRPRPRSTD